MSAPYRVFVTRELPGNGFAALRDDPDFALDVWPGDFPPSRENLLKRVEGVDGLVCLITDTIDAAVLDAAGEQLKVVSQMAVGVDNVDVAACAARGIPVGNTPGVLTETTADMAWALILAVSPTSGRGGRVRQGRRMEDLDANPDGRHRRPRLNPGHRRLRRNRTGDRQASPGIRHASPLLEPHTSSRPSRRSRSRAVRL